VLKKKEKFHEELASFKRQRIVDEATRLFYERGYQGTTLDDIADGLGVTKPFIYGHFANKQDLLYAAAEGGINRTIETIDRVLALKEKPEEKLRLLSEEMVRVVVEERPHIAVYFREEKYLTKEQAHAIDRKREKFDRRLAGLIKEGIELGAFEAGDPDLTSLAIGGMVSWIFTWHRPHGRLSDDALAAGMAQLVLKLVEPRKRRG
jgi:AcrR family transcriptional regulator